MIWGFAFLAFGVALVWFQSSANATQISALRVKLQTLETECAELRARVESVGNGDTDTEMHGDQMGATF